MCKSNNNDKRFTITNEDCGINKGFSSLQDAEWLKMDMDIMSSSDYGMNEIPDYDFLERMELELLKEELKHQEHMENPYDDTFLNELPF